jgi:hypothetical protein
LGFSPQKETVSFFPEFGGFPSLKEISVTGEYTFEEEVFEDISFF